jgi:hypothetical protein
VGEAVVMTIEGLAPYLAGPGAGLIICLLVGLGVYKLLRDLVVPMVQRGIDRHLDQVDAMMKQHSAEHTKILEGLDALNSKIS